MRRVFLDANVYLSFFRFGKDDLETMEKLIRLQGENEIKIVQNDQLRREIFRNRAGVIANAMKDADKKISIKLPAFVRSHPDFKMLNSQISTSSSLLRKVLSDIDELVENSELPADKLIARITESSEDMLIDDEIMEDARRRIELGDPPGKNGSIGDAIHWECLKRIDDLQIYVVSSDSDFFSPISRKLNPYLKGDLHGYALSDVHLYETLTDFLSDCFPSFTLAIEKKKNQIIAELSQSSSFSTTHALVSELSIYDTFTFAQAERMYEILYENNQIGWIATDPDVNALYKKIEFKAVGDEAALTQCEKLLGWDKFSLTIPF